ncbi:MAG TPA: oleate hydratase [Tepiditoga sp.]|nr:oleate hydratase [Tepiditoga sp.]
MKKSIAIIGAGAAGLASAVRLLKDGYNVDIYEKEKTVGGKMNRIEEKGFKFDVGPTIVMMPEVYREVFEYAGKNPDDYISMERLDPRKIYGLFRPYKTYAFSRITFGKRCGRIF